MKTAIAQLAGVGAISFSRFHDMPKIEGESHDAYEKRTWREKCHYDPKSTEVYIPGIVLKFALDWTAAQVGLKVIGRGRKTWATIFKSGVLCADPVMLGVKRDAVAGVPVRCHPQGRRGPGARVMRMFPIVENWLGTATFMILDDTIDEKIFKSHLVKAGQFCGLGRYAPRNGGHHGRFSVTEVLWQDEAVEEAA